jgi:hypothetical protein
MTKKDIYNEIYRQIYEVRFYMGYYCEGSKAYTPERAERFRYMQSTRVKAQEDVLLALASKLHISPLLKAWYMDAFNSGFNAESDSECIIPDNLVDKD